MEKVKTLYISDLDGTLLNQSAKLTERTKTSLNSMIENGLNFSVATARLLGPVSEMLLDVKMNIPIILMNGVLIYDIKERCYVKVNKLQPKIISAVIQTMKEFDITGFMYELSNGTLKTYHDVSKRKKIDEYLENRIRRYKSILPKNGLSSISGDSTIYFTMIDTHEQLQPVYETLLRVPGINQTFYKNIYNPDSWFLEILSADSSKKNAVDSLREIYGFKQVVGFGDNHNDLPMFEACDIKVAVENAAAEVKDAADFICESNNNDGVVKWLENALKQI